MTPPFPIFSRADNPLHDLSDWKRFAGPVSAHHWKEGYSACELARTWLTDSGLTALRAVLDLVPATRGFVPERGTAEAQTSFDSFTGPRNHDLLLKGEATGGATVVTIEGKVNEPFGQTLAQYRDDAEAKVKRGERTNAPARLAGLTRSLAGWELPSDRHDPRWLLRYQLFSAVAGTLAEADTKTAQAVFCVHELVTKVGDRQARAANVIDLARFITAVFPDAPRHGDRDGWITGPLRIAETTARLSSDLPLYVVKLTTSPA
jgi:hypothetical protein